MKNKTLLFVIYIGNKICADGAQNVIKRSKLYSRLNDKGNVLLQPLNVPEWLEGFADDSLRTTSVTAAEAMGEFFVKRYL